MHSIRRYRETFAKFLTVSAKLKRLEGMRWRWLQSLPAVALTVRVAASSSLPGANRLAFLRIREEECNEDDDSGESRAEREIQMMNDAVSVFVRGCPLARNKLTITVVSPQDGPVEVRTDGGELLEVDVQGKG